MHMDAATCDALTHAAELTCALAPSVDLWRAQNGYLELARAKGVAPVVASAESLERLGSALGIRIGVLEE
jgi:hypothetical protein